MVVSRYSFQHVVDHAKEVYMICLQDYSGHNKRFINLVILVVINLEVELIHTKVTILNKKNGPFEVTLQTLEGCYD